MKIITTHIGADFDSLASMVAASRLYPGATPCFSGSAGRNVRDFLKRYPGRWEVKTPRQIAMDDISLLVVVDARSPSRIGPFAAVLDNPGVEVHVYDHHPKVQEDIKASFSVIEPVGSATTLLVELLLERRVPITPQEATLYAMGVYEDTGALTFGAVSGRDFDAVSRLRELGADMTMIPAHIELSLDAAEKRIQDSLIDNARERYISGAKVVLSSLETDVYVDGLSLFVHRMRDFLDADVALAVVAMDKRVYVVARGRENILDVSEFLSPMGGGGHPQAASVTLTGGRPGDILKDLEAELEKAIRPLVTVSDIMTSPVMAVDPEVAVEEAYRIMIRYGHAALPVAREMGLEGIITRKDLDKARIHGLEKVPVREFMTEKPVTVSPMASVAEAHRRMVIHNIGRLPVEDTGELAGIVTRTDMLRALYPRSLPAESGMTAPAMPWVEDAAPVMRRGLSPWMISLLEQVGRRADSMGMRAYAVGGFVRDLIIGRQNEDLDIVIEGDAVDFIRSWEADGCRVAVHSRFRTGTVVFPGEHRIDVATARREFYEYPVAQPTVASDSLKHDLYRRDYSVNAMALSLNPDSRGRLVDYFGGRRDLQRKELRVLHNLSFVEDPTRVLRGIRIEQRLGFHFEENTLRLLKSCIRGGLLSLLSGVRLRSEVELIFREKAVYEIVRRFQELGFWEAVFPGVKPGNSSMRCFRRLRAFFRRLSRDLPDFGDDSWLAFLGALIFDSAEFDGLAAVDRLHLSPRERKIVLAGVSDLRAAEQDLGGRAGRSRSEIYAFLNDTHPVTALFWAAATVRWRVRRRILLFLTRLQRVEPMLVGRDLLDMGYHEGPAIGRMLSELRRARLDGDVETREDEIEWVARHNGKDRKEV